MEPQKKGAKTTAKGEDGSVRSSSSSSGSAESASSEFSFEERGNSARENKGSDKGKLKVKTSSSLESPSAQVMEMPNESSEYRIPAHVFAPSTPNHGDWSNASNESLFSIHTGNMSFTGDSYMLKSGEFCAYAPTDLHKSGELPPLSPTALQKSGGMTIASPNSKIITADLNTPSPTQSPPSAHKVSSSPRFSVESNGNKKNEIKMDEMPLSTSTISHQSNASCQSFAFPVLTGIDKQKSVNSGASRVEEHKEVKEEKTPEENAAAESATHTSLWFSRLLCCSCWTSKQS